MTDSEQQEKQLENRTDNIKKIYQIESVLAQAPQHEFKTTHHFSKGIYAREIFIPAGALLTGKIHKHENLNIVSQGIILVYTEDGLQEVTAPATIVSKPGTKRVGYALTDTVWTCIHATEETDLDKIEAEVIAEDYNAVPGLSEKEMEQIKGALCLG